ncbi:MAG: GHKL domain-containing protein [Oscillospiraceae bacterium]|nr:GHKL domain-containing protein [Oscillospiraceae bacterium]
MGVIQVVLISIAASVSMLVNIVLTCDTIWGCKNLKINGLNAGALSFFVLVSTFVPFSTITDIIAPYSAIIMPVYYASLLISVKILTRSKISRVGYIFLLYIFSDSLFRSVAGIIFGFFQQFNIYHYEMMYGYSLFFNLLCITAMLLCRKGIILKNLQNNISLMPKRIYVLLLIIIFFGGGLAASQIDEIFHIELRAPFLIFFTLINILILLITTISLLFNSVSRKYYENISSILDLQLKKQIRHYEQIEELNSDLRAFKHDYNNHMLCLKSMIESQNNIEALKYIEDLTSSFKETQKTFDTGNSIADALLNEKNDICIKNGITYEHDGHIPPSGITAVDLCILLFNMLDNAIEACEKITNGAKEIKTVSDFKNNYFYIKASNTTKEPVKIQNNFIPSTKPGHGFGLTNIRRVAEKYDGSIKLNCDGGLFQIEAVLNVP